MMVPVSRRSPGLMLGADYLHCQMFEVIIRTRDASRQASVPFTKFAPNLMVNSFRNNLLLTFSKEVFYE